MIRLACSNCNSIHVVQAKTPIVFICAACKTVTVFDPLVLEFLARDVTTKFALWFNYSPALWATWHYGRIADVYESDTDTIHLPEGTFTMAELNYSVPEHEPRSVWRRRA